MVAAILETVRPSIHSLNVTCLPGVFVYGLFRRKGEHKAPCEQKGQGMHLNDHEKLWIVERYVDRLAELCKQEPNPENGEWNGKMLAISVTAKRIYEITE